MIRILLKKQLTEIFRSYFYNPKKNKARSKISMIGMFVLFVLLMAGLLGGMFGYLAHALCGPLQAAGVSWLYFAILGMLAILFGTFGSVFNTFAGLYLGKDNNLLLAMPIPVRAILISRLLGVFLMSLMYAGIVCLPTLIIWWITAGFSLGYVVGGLLWMLLIVLFVVILSCVLGWVVARISVKLKNRSFVTALLAIVFIALYYFVYFKAQKLLQTLVANAALYGEQIKGSARILYGFGLAGTGSHAALGIMTAVILVLLAVVGYVLNRSFLKIATATGGTARVKYREKAARQSSADAALLRKELSRFTGSANYMLNCGLGILMAPALGIFLLIKGKAFLPLLDRVLGGGSTALIFCAMLFSICSMISTAAPSVSLEGRTLWQLQCLPVTPWQALRAKLRLNLLMSAPPTLFCAVCLVIVGGLKPVLTVLVLAFTVCAVCVNALFGLFMNVKLPNLTWTNETVPIKQSGAIAATLFGAMGFSAAMAILYFAVLKQPDTVLFLGLTTLLLAILSVVLYCWLRTRGAERFRWL